MSANIGKNHLEQERANDRKRYAEGRKKNGPIDRSTPVRIIKNSNNVQNKKVSLKEYSSEYERLYQWRRRELHRIKQESDPQYRLRRALRSSLKNAIKNNQRGGSAIKLLGCSINELKSHLEKQFRTGMTWENFGRLKGDEQTWQIDHIQPLSSFDLTDPDQVRIVCNFTNLQPLWSIDNRRKWNKTA